VMTKPTIDADELLGAFEDCTGTEWMLDRVTGEVFPLFGDGREEEEEVRERVAAEPRRYVWIRPRPSGEGYRIMEDFIDSLPPGRARAALDRAIDRPRPFRSFKTALGAFPEAREQWFRYHETRMLQYARDWLAGEGIDAELAPPPALERTLRRRPVPPPMAGGA